LTGSNKEHKNWYTLTHGNPIKFSKETFALNAAALETFASENSVDYGAKKYVMQ